MSRSKYCCIKCENPDRTICKMCINRHPIIRKLYDAGLEIEQGGGNEHLTMAQTYLDEVKTMIDDVLCYREE